MGGREDRACFTAQAVVGGADHRRQGTRGRVVPQVLGYGADGGTHRLAIRSEPER